MHLFSILFVLLFSSEILCDETKKVLVYIPLFGHSHVKFLGNIADILAEEGIDVTVLMLEMEPNVRPYSARHSKNIIHVKSPSYVTMYHDEENLVGFRTDLWTMSPSPVTLLNLSHNMTLGFSKLCETLFDNEGLINRLIDEKFDLGIAEPFTICGFGFFERIGIKNTIISLTTTHMDTVSSYIGEPSALSYVPGGLATFGEKMSMSEKMQNMMQTYFGKTFFERTYEGEQAAIHNKMGKSFKNYKELLADSSYVFVNSNPYLDFPHPSIQKSIHIGGIGVNITKNIHRSLSKEWDRILNERKQTVLISFGSVAHSQHMPKHIKDSLITLFSSLPHITFIWKYEEENANLVDDLSNVYLSTWVPQNELLADPRLNLFITHGGLGSTTELAYMGKPAIMIPLFGDQSRNSNMLSRHGGAKVLTKFDLAKPKLLKEIILDMIENKRYSENAKRLSDILVNQPINPRENMVRHVNFALRVGRISNLEAYSRHQSFIEYYLLDIISIITVISISLPYIIYRLIRYFIDRFVSTK